METIKFLSQFATRPRPQNTDFELVKQEFFAGFSDCPKEFAVRIRRIADAWKSCGQPIGDLRIVDARLSRFVYGLSDEELSRGALFPADKYDGPHQSKSIYDVICEAIVAELFLAAITETQEKLESLLNQEKIPQAWNHPPWLHLFHELDWQNSRPTVLFSVGDIHRGFMRSDRTSIGDRSGSTIKSWIKKDGLKPAEIKGNKPLYFESDVIEMMAKRGCRPRNA